MTTEASKVVGFSTNIFSEILSMENKIIWNEWTVTNRIRMDDGGAYKHTHIYNFAHASTWTCFKCTFVYGNTVLSIEISRSLNKNIFTHQQKEKQRHTHQTDRVSARERGCKNRRFGSLSKCYLVIGMLTQFWFGFVSDWGQLRHSHKNWNHFENRLEIFIEELDWISSIELDCSRLKLKQNRRMPLRDCQFLYRIYWKFYFIFFSWNENLIEKEEICPYKVVARTNRFFINSFIHSFVLDYYCYSTSRIHCWCVHRTSMRCKLDIWNVDSFWICQMRNDSRGFLML